MNTNLIKLFLLFCCFSVGMLQAQHIITVIDQQTNKPIPSVLVSLYSPFIQQVSDLQGRVELKVIDSRSYTLVISHIAYEKKVISWNPKPGTSLKIKLLKKINSLNEIFVFDNVALHDKPTTISTIEKTVIQDMDSNKDLPFFLEHTPSVFVSSDAGTGMGYTQFRIRGSDITRIHAEINGVPINDAESLLVYWVNTPDLVSSAKNIQIQRGLGNSVHGSGSFGGSVHINTLDFSPDLDVNFKSAFGSFNSFSNSISLDSGELNKFNFKFRASLLSSDGYIDRAEASLLSWFFSARYKSLKHITWVNVFSGKERTYQAWNGVPEALLESNRTFNLYTYENQVDDYQQDHIQLINSQILEKNWLLKFTLHYTKGKGFFEELQALDLPSNYGLEEQGSNRDMKQNIVRRRWLDNDFYGFNILVKKSRNNGELVFSLATHQYLGLHFDQVIWTQERPNTLKIYDREKGDKREFNTFLKYSIIKNSISYSFDIQYRYIQYLLTDQQAVFDTYEPVSLKYSFFNPKLSINYRFNRHHSIYLHLAHGHKEPNRADLIAAIKDISANPLPIHEQLFDIELGYSLRKKKIDNTFNLFFMFYHNQLVQNGRFNQDGAPLSENVARSHRIGLENSFSLKLGKLKQTLNVSLSQNIIYQLNSDIFGLLINTNISFSPSFILSNHLHYALTPALKFFLSSHYTAKQYIGNISDPNAVIDSYFKSDAHLTYTFLWKKKSIHLSLKVHNVFNELYETAAWGFVDNSGDENVYVNNYFPQATRHFQLLLRFRI